MNYWKTLFIRKQKRHLASESKVRERKSKFCLLNEPNTNYLLWRLRTKQRKHSPKGVISTFPPKKARLFFDPSHSFNTLTRFVKLSLIENYSSWWQTLNLKMSDLAIAWITTLLRVSRKQDFMIDIRSHFVEYNILQCTSSIVSSTLNFGQLC